jgi:DNA-binding NarL/FixJ family response regulator
MPVRFLLVDDHSLYREGLKTLLATESDYIVAGQAPDARAALAQARDVMPDVAIVDIQLPGSSGIALASDLMRLSRQCRVLVLTMHDADHHVTQALDIGVAGYALKRQAPEEILEAIRVIIGGGTYVPPWAPQWIVDRHSRRGRGEKVASDSLDELSRREREVFDLVIRGMTNETVGKELDISIKTVETHRARINRKLGVNSPAALVRFAAMRGLLGDA